MAQVVKHFEDLEDTRAGMGFFFGIVLLVTILLVLFLWGLPAMTSQVG